MTTDDDAAINLASATDLARFSKPSLADAARVNELAGSIAERGYQPQAHDGMDGWPIEIMITSAGPYLSDGNHRIHALSLLSYTGRVPVLVRGLPQEALSQLREQQAQADLEAGS
jgi:hypothetical protein